MDLNARWSQADPAVHRWVEENRAAMAIFRQGTERPDALEPARPSPRTARDPHRINFRSFLHWPCSRHRGWRSSGDMAGALDLVSRGPACDLPPGPCARRLMRSVARSPGLADVFTSGSSTWAADPRTTPRPCSAGRWMMWWRARRFMPSDSYTIEAEYASLEGCSSHLDPRARQAPDARLDAALGLAGRSGRLDRIRSWRSPTPGDGWRREPERSRRVLRLAIANWLAYYELPPDRRPAPDPGVAGPFDFYPFGARGAGPGPCPVARGPGPMARYGDRRPEVGSGRGAFRASLR